MARVDIVLFDLDGTLVDSAPDLAGAANEQRARHGLPALPFDVLRPMAGSGARGMVGRAFGRRPGETGYDDLRAEFLDLYRQRLLRETTVFGRIGAVLDRLDSQGRRWGIVTNKALHMAEPIVGGLGLAARAGVLIGGDSTPFIKPHPAPLLEAARRLRVAVSSCAYVGDDARDMRAGRAAGMATLAAAWGYLGEGEAIQDWGADAVLEDPDALLNWIELA